MSIKENWTFQPGVLAEIYTAMEFATEVCITYKKGQINVPIQGQIHYLDFSSDEIRLVDRLANVYFIPILMINSIVLLKEN